MYTRLTPYRKSSNVARQVLVQVLAGSFLGRSASETQGRQVGKNSLCEEKEVTY